jgi:ribonuclease Z
MPPAFDIVFLGTGSPIPSPDRCGCGHVVVAGDARVLVDCGYGAARRLLPAGIVPATIDTAVFTHMHTDHITDVPDFLNLRWTSGATKPLKVYGPTGTKKMMDGFLMALEDDIRFRTAHHPGKLHPDGIKVDVTEIPATPDARSFATQEGDFSLESFEVDHFPVVPALGYRFRFDGRSAVLSGDTSMCDSLLAAAQGADLLVSDALNPAMFALFTEQVRAVRPITASLFDDVPSYHIHTPEVAKLARDAGVGKLVLSHLLPNLPNNPEMEAQFSAGMSDIYPGPIQIARDTQRIAVEKRNGS